MWRVWLQVQQGAHASKAQQADWRVGRKGGVGANVAVGADADDRGSAFTDVKVRTGEEGAAATSGGGEEPGTANASTNSAGDGQWTKELELALIKAMKAFGKDVPDRCETAWPALHACIQA
jgi:hypothetical protein